MYVKGVKRSSKYTVMQCMLKVLKKLKIHYKDCNAMYVEGVKRSSKYTVEAVMLCMSNVSKETQNTL